MIPTSGTSGVCSRTAATSAAIRAGCSAGGIGRVGSTVGVGWDISRLQGRVQHRTPEARGLRRPDGSIDTGMPIASRRATRTPDAVVRQLRGPGNEAPEATEVKLRPLM